MYRFNPMFAAPTRMWPFTHVFEQRMAASPSRSAAEKSFFAAKAADLLEWYTWFSGSSLIHTVKCLIASS